MRFRARSGAGPHTEAFSCHVLDASNGGRALTIHCQHSCPGSCALLLKRPLAQNNRLVETRLAASPMVAASPTATKARLATPCLHGWPEPGKRITQSCRTTLSSELWTCKPPSKPPE